MFHTLVNSLREMAQSEEDAGKREVARRRAVGMLLYAVLGDGSVYQNEVVLVVGGKDDEVPAEVKADLYYALLRALGYQQKMTKAERGVYIRLHGEDAKRFARDALPYLVALERMIEVVKSDEQIYSKMEKMADMARAEKVKAWIKDFATEGGRPRARLVVEADGAAAEFSIRLHEGNAVVLSFGTSSRGEAERRAAVLRAVGVRAEVKKTYDKSRGRDMWYIDVSTNALAAESVHEAVRNAVVEFLQRCREAGVLEEDTYSRLVKKFERGIPEWGEIRFSVKLRKDGSVDVIYQPSDPQSFNKAVEFLRGLGMRGTCEGEWCFIHFTAREPEGGRLGYVRITVDGLMFIGWLASRGGERAQWLKEMLLKEAEAKGEKVRQRLEEYFREGERWDSVRPPVEREVEVDGRRLKVRVEAVEAWRERKERKEHLVVEIRAKVEEEGRVAAVDKEVRFYKRSNKGDIKGYVVIRADAEGGREADYQRTAAVLKALGVERWSRGKEEVHLTGGALEVLIRLEPVCRALGVCQKT